MTSKAADSTWTQYSLGQPQRRRAELVCLVCHSKKTKCDLQACLNRGFEKCTYCANTGRKCEARSSKRKRGQQRAEKVDMPQVTHIPTPASVGVLSGINGSESDHRQSNAPKNLQINPGRHQKQSIGRNERPEAPAAMRFSELAESHEGDIDTGFLQPFIEENRIDARTQVLNAKTSRRQSEPTAAVSPDLLHIFIETYYDSCYTWCPVLDRGTILEELKSSPMLANAMAALGSNLQPPMLPFDGPASYYNRARRIFYEDEESDALTCLRAVLLFYWWAPRATSLVHRHSSWWWTSVVIRHAQQMNLHRAQSSKAAGRSLLGLQRRVWWTAFARERLTALCQSKPAIINPEDCTVPEPTLEDFPSDMQHSVKPQIFIYWVRLCSILGRIAQHLSHPGPSAVATLGSPRPLSLRNPAHDLTTWIRNLSPSLGLRISEEYTSSYDKDICQLHLPYLTAVIVLNLKRASEPGSIPQAAPPAVFAASCTARIFKDILARGDTRFLMAITSWHCAVSFLALLSASRDPALRRGAKADMEIVRLMCDQLRRMWGSANVVYQGIERLYAVVDREDGSGSVSHMTDNCSPLTQFGEQSATGQSTENIGMLEDTPDWMDYFPFATARTSEIARPLLELKEQNEKFYLEATTLSNYLSSDMQDYFFEGFNDADMPTFGEDF